ncbi:EAL domain-containing protein [Sphaerotilus sp.]|uniref:EAL domain-containing protein n=1 Tax=Sphaerotilus sp. TaxID=2093942 RepID=UPI0034E207D8
MLLQCCCGLVLLFGILGTARAVPATVPIDLSSGAVPVSLVEGMVALKQAPGQVSSGTEVLNQPGWLPATEPNRNSTWIPNAVWLTAVLHNSSAEPLTRWIVLSPWRIRDVQFHALQPDTLHELDHQHSGSGWPMAARVLHHVEPVFPVTLAPGASLRILIRAQDETVPTTVIEAWTPDTYTRALSWTLVHETITLTVCLMLVGLLLWTSDPASWMLAGLLTAAECFSATIRGQLLPYFAPAIVGHLVPVFTISAALCYCLFTLSSRALLDVGRRGVWAWVLGGLNALALLAAIGTLFSDQPLALRKLVNTLGEAVFVAWPLAAWRTPRPDRPGSRALQCAFAVSAILMGTAVWVSRKGKPVQFAELTVLCVLLVYIHARLASQKAERLRTEHLAFHDALTQLPNRVRGHSLLHRALAEAHRQHRSVGLLYLDLNKFKLVNDAHGHATGDALLQAVAVRLQNCLGAGDTACRLSGDEFMAVMPSTRSSEQVVHQCEAIVTAFSRPFEIDGVQLFLSVSIGAAVHPEHAQDAEVLMRHADTALYVAKQSGENRFRMFHPDMNTQLMAHISTRSALHLALERQEFELHFQPQIGLQRGDLVGVEALLRWRRPGQPVNQPGEFIAVAEESGLIVPIGAWVLHEACRQAATWLRDGWAPLKMAVNVSPVQFQSGTLVQDVSAALAASGLSPACLELELTESVLIGTESEALRTIGQLKALGVGLSIDDFGTGYSSLAYLHRFRFDRIKIDRSFIARLGQGPDEQAIVRAIVQMARHLNLRTTAEGVENAEAVERLTDIGCDEVQGFHYALALPAAALDRWRQAFQQAAAV